MGGEQSQVATTLSRSDSSMRRVFTSRRSNPLDDRRLVSSSGLCTDCELSLRNSVWSGAAVKYGE